MGATYTLIEHDIARPHPIEKSKYPTVFWSFASFAGFALQLIDSRISISSLDLKRNENVRFNL